MNTNFSPAPAKNTKKSNRKSILIVAVIGSIAIVIALGMLILSFFGVFKNEQPESLFSNNSSIDNTTNSIPPIDTTEEDDLIPQQPVTINRVFVGTYVTATIPENWNIIEYSNKDGLVNGMSLDGVFNGLTGLEILDENNAVVFSLEGIDGIGGSGACTSVAQFSDTEVSYIQNIKDTNEIVGSEPPQVINLINAEYSEINTLGLRLRRVENKLYVAETFAIPFNPECGITEKVVRIDELGFTVDNSSPIDAYRIEINPAVLLESTLEELDEVLLTLKPKSAS